MSDPNANFVASKLFDLSGKVAIVTGGGSGIGLMITQALIANGAKVYIVGRTQEKLDTVVKKYAVGKADGKIIPLQFDITKKEQITALHKEFSSKEQQLDILVNNSGISTESFTTEADGSAAEMKKNLFEHAKATLDDWSEVYRTNVAAQYFVSLAFLPELEKSTNSGSGWSGAIINVASISGMVKQPQHHFQYNASKAAFIHVSRMLANLINENNVKIRVNTLSPGVFPSEMTTNESNEDQKSHIPKEKFEGKVLAARPGKDEDMAQTALYLAGCQYLNGQNVAVDGGYTLMAGF